MSQTHSCIGFSDIGFYDCFESIEDVFESPSVDSEILFRTKVFRWHDQGELIHTGTLESIPSNAYCEVGHLEWDPAEPNVLHCMDTDSNEGGDSDSIASQSSRIDQFMFMARGEDPPSTNPTTVDPNVVVDNDAEILGD